MIQLMNKKIFFFGFVILLIAILLFFFLPKRKNPTHLNVLIITLDTCRADHFGCYGNHRVKTPNVDLIASQGIRFENCYSPVPLTLPAHCSIFTGKYSIGHRVRNNGRYFLSEKETTMAELFREQGYQTYAVVAAFVLLSKFGLNQGFNIYDDSLDTYKMVSNFKSEIPADQVYKKFKHWFDHQRENRFFAWIHFYDPHTPYHPPRAYVKEGEETDLQALYRGEISFMDSYIGKIIDDLRGAHILDKTLVVLAGDHGEAFGEHLEFASHMIFCYEENLKVPLIFFNKQMFREKRVVKERVNLIDIMPTILELFEIQYKGNTQGKSFINLLDGEEEAEPRTFYFETIYGKEEMNWAPLTGIIEGDYKFISLPNPELYDLKKDRNEKQNLFRIKSNISRKMDKNLGEMILKNSNLNPDTRRDLTKKDIEQLRSLGYISSFSNKSATAIDPKRGVVYNNKMKELSRRIESGDLDQAEAELKKIGTETPELKNFLFYNLFYKIYKKRNDLNSALRILKEVIQEFPEYLAFRMNLSLLYFDLKQYEKVIRNCTYILDKDPLYTRALILLGDTFDSLHNAEEALKNYHRATTLEPENVSLKIKYSELLIKYKKFTDALSVYSNLLEKKDVTESPEILYKIALFNAQYGSRNRAEELLYKIINLKPEGKYYYYFALILARNGKLSEAIRHMETALTTYSDQLSAEQKSKGFKALDIWRKNI